ADAVPRWGPGSEEGRIGLGRDPDVADGAALLLPRIGPLMAAGIDGDRVAAGEAEAQLVDDTGERAERVRRRGEPTVLLREECEAGWHRRPTSCNRRAAGGRPRPRPPGVGFYD